MERRIFERRDIAVATALPAAMPPCMPARVRDHARAGRAGGHGTQGSRRQEALTAPVETTAGGSRKRGATETEPVRCAGSRGGLDALLCRMKLWRMKRRSRNRSRNRSWNRSRKRDGRCARGRPPATRLRRHPPGSDRDASSAPRSLHREAGSRPDAFDPTPALGPRQALPVLADRRHSNNAGLRHDNARKADRDHAKC